jgi:acetyl-CoA acetyltransferase
VLDVRARKPAAHPRDVAIVAHAQTPFGRRTGRSPFTIAADLLDQILAKSGIDKRAIDGLALGSSYHEVDNAFWSNFVLDYLGLSVSWVQVSDLGGAMHLSLLDRACAAIRSGQCETVLLLGADTQIEEMELPLRHGGYRGEWERVQGLPGPPGEFGLLLNRYKHLYELDENALAKIAVTQRAGAVNHPDACEAFRKPLTSEQYFASKMIADPIRLLDCVMPCDGGGALLITSADVADASGWTKRVYPAAYAERTNLRPDDPVPDVLSSGFSEVGPKALAAAGLQLEDVRMFFPYDDFTIAVILQLEEIGFCKRGEGSRFVLGTDISHTGRLPINPGGGMLSMGQPGFTAGLVNLVEAVTQLFDEAGPRQVPQADNALVCGIGMIPLLRNFGTTNAMVLER